MVVTTGKTRKVWGLILLSSVLGFSAIVLPPFVFSDKIPELWHAPLFPIFGRVMENLLLFQSVTLLFFGGLFLGLLKPEFWLISGCSTMLVFPAVAIVEECFNLASHNLMPLEFLQYGILSVPGLMGAYIGSLLRKMLKNRKQGKEGSGQAN